MFGKLSPARWADSLTVRQQTAIMTGLLCVATVGVVTVGAALLARRTAIHEANLDLAAMARTMADRLDQNMFERYREIKNIANLEPLRDVWRDDAARTRTVLTQFQSTLENYAWLGFARPDGIVHAATRGMLEGVSVAQRPWFVDGLKGPAVGDVHDAKLLEHLLRRAPDSAPFRFVDVAMPVLARDGGALGVLGAHLSWNWAAELRVNILLKHDLELESDIWVLGRSGNVLLGPKDAATFAPERLAEALTETGSSFEDRSGDRPMLTTLAATRGQGDYPGLGWIVAARRPAQVALGPAHALTMVIGLLGLLTAAAGAALAWLLAGTVSLPLTRLGRAIDLIGRDPEAGAIQRQHGSRDVLQLSAAMRSLLRRLGTAERDVRDAHDAIREVRHQAQEQARAADEYSRRLGSDIRTLKQLADADPLTGLLNRRAFLPFAYDAMAEHRSDRRAFCVLMFDIDHFKRVNDSFGHAAGDEVIRAIGRIISGRVRVVDKVARFGGEEFVVLLRDADMAGTAVLAEQIREAIEITVGVPGQPGYPITVSIGGAMAQTSDRDIEDVIARADTALYQAKSGGRNRVVIAAPEPALNRAA